MIKRYAIHTALLFSLVAAPIVGFTGGNELIRIPSADLPEPGQLEVGLSVGAGTETGDRVYAYTTFASLMISDFFQYNAQLDGTQVRHAIQTGIEIEPGNKSGIRHYVGAGVKNLGNTDADRRHHPTIGEFINYSANLGNTVVHGGVGRNRGAGNEFLPLAGVEHELDFGTGLIEWDGQNVSFGFRAKFIGTYSVFVAFTPLAEPSNGFETQVLSFGISLSRIIPFLNNEFFAKNPEATSEETKIRTSLIPKIKIPADKKRPSEAYYRMTRGQKYFYEGKYVQAKNEFETAINIVPTAKGYTQLGSTYYKMGRYLAAEEAWRRALELDPENQEIRAALQRVIAEREEP